MTSSSQPLEAGPAPVIGEIGGRQVVLRYSDPVREYEALRDGAMLVDRSYRVRFVFEGERAAGTLAGLVSNDVLGLSPGEGQYAAALTPKGKIIADVRLFREEERVLADVPPRAAEGWTAMLRKYVNPRLTRWSDVSDQTGIIGVFGARSRHVVADLSGISAAALQAMPLYAHHSVAVAAAGGALTIARVPELGLEGYDLFASTDALRELWSRAFNTGATPAGLEAWEIARIEAGRPEWGLDINDSTLPQEANFDELHAISYTKGCYTGQETVARIHFRGHVNRLLRGLRSTSSSRLPAGAQLMDENGRAVGDVRSSTISPRLGNIALAMVRREVPLGSTLTCRWSTGESGSDLAEVTVWPLPFPL